MIPGGRIRYLSEISEQGRGTNTDIDRQSDAASRLQHIYEALRELEDPDLPAAFDAFHPDALADNKDRSVLVLRQRYQETLKDISAKRWHSCGSGRLAARRSGRRSIATRCAGQSRDRCELPESR